MTAWRWPRSLPGQVALLVAIALFVAQAINFAMLLRERRQARFAGVSGAAVTRLVDANERIEAGRPPPREARPRQRGRVVQVAANPIGPDAVAVPEVEAAVRSGLADAGVSAGRIVTSLTHIARDDRALTRLPRDVADRYRRAGSRLTIAVEQPGRGWLVSTLPWPGNNRGLIVQLVAQTLVLYGIVLLAVLWIGNRIARPLRSLAQAARAFRPGEEAAAVPEAGPSDVRAVIAAHNALAARVSAMLGEKDRMLGAIGHDLRTPLAALRVRIESVEDEQDRSRMADIIDEMAATLEDILSLARLGRSSEPMVEVDLSALVDAVVEDFRDLGHDITADEAARLTLRLRPGLMRRAVRNLIENAIKYAGAAEVRLDAAPGEARVEVLDRGPGIAPDKLAGMFDPFVRGETSRNRETGGIGLGLALARAIVEQAGGTISLANRSGGGLAATITLPVPHRDAGNPGRPSTV